MKSIEPTPTTPELVEKARDGAQEAFGQLVESHWVSLVRLARSVVGDADAEDVVQEGLLRCWKKLPELRRPELFSLWARRIVLRSCLKRSRRRRRWVDLTEAPEAATRPDPGAELDVERLLATLAPRQRAVMHMTVIERMSDGEIAEVMGIAPASVRSHRRRAREQLIHQLDGRRKP